MIELEEPSARQQRFRTDEVHKNFYLQGVMGFDKREVGGLSVKVMYI
tara:strand:+ start:744 stop:884 length:141 start_codon:yes stop_codon:yes gene_type:complete